MLTFAASERSEGLAAFLEADLRKDLLRFTTAGSVDDGKSTLIGRLLHDAKAVYEDHVASVQKSKINRSSGSFDFSLLTDGLRAEREQGITIDVAYRYFSTLRRKFIIADTPGHEQYTRNMATGASTADLAIILVDATKGLLTQTHRHAYIASLLGIRRVVAAINKMDLVDYREDVFLRFQEDFLSLASRLGITSVACIPISALAGDNVVSASENTPWYAGPTLLGHLETVDFRHTGSFDAVRFPIQYVVRPDFRFRGFAGQLASGSLGPGDALLALPSGQETRVKAIVGFEGNRAQAFAPQSITLELANEIDLSRGDMLVSPSNLPAVSSSFSAAVVWLHAEPLLIGKPLLLKQTTRVLKARVRRILHRVNVNTLQHEPAERLEMNGIAEVEVETNQPLFLDAYSTSRATGSFILIDPFSNATVGAGIVRETFLAGAAGPGDRRDARVTGLLGEVAVAERYRRHGHKPGVFLLGNRLSLARLLERAFFQEGFEVVVVDGSGVASPVLAGFLTSLFSAGMVVLCTNTALAPQDLAQFPREDIFEAARIPDAAKPDAETADAQVIEDAVSFAEKLRFSSEHHPAGKEF
ncbi:MAG TPA: sulfate adenylyltransferase subunit CysN [Candidatus Acidoferrum sp.]|jgi:sulfate adenylyltransferase large subunit|nr:sulfate adenylyltransferase subunit CysN [Candidatus Acidoferrum sp.]